MSVVSMIWLASVAGAFLFAAAGYFIALAKRQRPSAIVAAAALPPPPAIPKPDRIETGELLDSASLQRFVDNVVKTPTVRSAALTDELGFLVVGQGEHTEALAAFGAFLTDAGERARGLLPINAVQKVSIEDSAGYTLTAHAIASAPHELVLVTLGTERST